MRLERSQARMNPAIQSFSRSVETFHARRPEKPEHRDRSIRRGFQRLNQHVSTEVTRKWTCVSVTLTLSDETFPARRLLLLSLSLMLDFIFSRLGEHS